MYGTLRPVEHKKTYTSVVGRSVLFAKGRVYQLFDGISVWLTTAARNGQILTFLACLLILLWRQRDRLTNAHIWAEDGSVFLAQFWEFGWPALFTPYAGYLHVVPRLIASLAASLSIDYLPHLVLLLTSALYAFCASLLVSRDYEHLIPSTLTRVTAALALCFAPGLGEIVGNVANTHSVLYFGATLLCLRDPLKGFSALDLVLLILAGLSAGEMVVLIPVFGLRVALILWTGRQLGDQTVFRSVLWSNGAALVSLCLLSAITFLIWLGAKDSPPPTWTFSQFLEPSLRSLVNRFMLYPWMTDGNLIALNESLTLLVLAALAAALFIGFGVSRLAFLSRFVLLGVLTCACGGIALIWVVRPDAAAAGFTLPSHRMFQHRYAFPGTFLGVILAAIAVSAFRNRFLRTVVSLGLPLLAWDGAAGRRTIDTYGSQRDWAATAQKIRSTLDGGCPAVSTVRINPEGWYMRVHADSKVTRDCSTTPTSP